MEPDLEEKCRVKKLYEWENVRRKENGFIAGVDEAGRGPMAGPVVASAVILPSSPEISYIDDSKKLSPKLRERVFHSIVQTSLAVGIGIRSAKYIDEKGISAATFSAMRTAISELVSQGFKPGLVAVDGYPIPQLEFAQEAVIKGDAKISSIACASIVAKVVRDRIMVEFDRLYPGYEFSIHKGYCTKLHMDLLYRKGPSPIHRRSFRPVRDVLPPFPSI
ncbi:MAG: ribonuclease HII [Firmicutes bacterium]|nr:ribonuclease HII [Candidatus Fermentithermobacillaceae bacterium]